ncbi:MAG: acetate--CoA ligase family protein, partial [Deltaproteobacteria bacterium]|nr:acetate--CoA ligase family protein [Deltaproteobacteria bacterium]
MNLDSVLDPRSILVVGVSESRTNAAGHIVGNLVSFGYKGVVHALGTKPGTVCGHPIRTSIDDVPDGIDLAVVMTPARTVPGLLDACGRKGIRHAIVQSGGFGELGEEGAAVQQAALDAARRHGIRFVGPNCLGALAPAAGVCTFFVPFEDFFDRGRVSLGAQSGGVGATYLYQIASEGIGLRRFVSMGNKLDVDEADLVTGFAADEGCDVVALYIEDVKRGRAFFDAIKGCAKPVLIQRAGRTAAGQKAAFSHTAALAADDAVLSAAIRQAGGLRVRSAEEMMCRIKAFLMPPMRGRRLAVISRSGGHAVIGADCATDEGFDLPPFPQDFLSSLGHGWADSVIRRGNPLDLGDIFDFAAYARILDAVLSMPEFDGAVFVHEYFAKLEGETARRLVPAAEEAVRRHGKPVALVLFTDEEEVAHLKRHSSFPFYTSVECAVGALSASWKHERRKARKASNGGTAPGGVAEAAARVRELAGMGRTSLLCEGLDVLGAAGVRVPWWGLVRSAEDAPDRLGHPVAVKAVSARAVHKTEAGGVVLDVRDPAHLRRVIEEMSARFGPFGEGEGVLVQRMCAPATEVIVGGG